MVLAMDLHKFIRRQTTHKRPTEILVIVIGSRVVFFNAGDILLRVTSRYNKFKGQASKCRGRIARLSSSSSRSFSMIRTWFGKKDRAVAKGGLGVQTWIGIVELLPKHRQHAG